MAFIGTSARSKPTTGLAASLIPEADLRYRLVDYRLSQLATPEVSGQAGSTIVPLLRSESVPSTTGEEGLSNMAAFRLRHHHASDSDHAIRGCALVLSASQEGGACRLSDSVPFEGAQYP